MDALTDHCALGEQEADIFRRINVPMVCESGMATCPNYCVTKG
jgi:hypothetical protein